MHKSRGTGPELRPCLMEVSRAHWSTRVRERALWRDAAGRLPLELSGGAETGHFIWICPLSSAAHRDILLEVEGLPVSGLHLYDVLNVLKNCEDPIRIKTVKAGGRLKKDLSYFLSQRFQKGSADQQLQESVRINLYHYAAPCESHTYRHRLTLLERVCVVKQIIQKLRRDTRSTELEEPTSKQLKIQKR